MLFAAQALRKGYAVAYAAEAMVYHSHNFTLRQQYQRNWIQGYELSRNAELLGSVSRSTEGMKLIKYVSKNLLRHGRVLSFIKFGLDCIARWLGSRNGEQAWKKALNK